MSVFWFILHFIKNDKDKKDKSKIGNLYKGECT